MRLEVVHTHRLQTFNIPPLPPKSPPDKTSVTQSDFWHPYSNTLFQLFDEIQVRPSHYFHFDVVVAILFSRYAKDHTPQHSTDPYGRFHFHFIWLDSIAPKDHMQTSGFWLFYANLKVGPYSLQHSFSGQHRNLLMTDVHVLLGFSWTFCNKVQMFIPENLFVLFFPNRCIPN